MSHAAQARSTLHRQGPASTGCSLVFLHLGCSMHCLSALKSHEMHQAEDRKATLNLRGARSGVHTEPQTPHDTKSARYIKIDRQNIYVTRKRHKCAQDIAVCKDVSLQVAAHPDILLAGSCTPLNRYRLSCPSGLSWPKKQGSMSLGGGPTDSSAGI